MMYVTKFWIPPLHPNQRISFGICEIPRFERVENNQIGTLAWALLAGCERFRILTRSANRARYTRVLLLSECPSGSVAAIPFVHWGATVTRGKNVACDEIGLLKLCFRGTLSPTL